MKRIKMCIYGEPGVGKSTFAVHSPKPFFICTDGNYDWLEDFGAKQEDHIQVYSWDEAKKVFSQSFDGYETIVVDLTEDLFKWCEYEFCKKGRYEHISDLGYGKGYDITRNEFFIELCKLINKDKNIIFIMHGVSVTTKDRRGIEHSKYCPTSRIPDKVIDQLEGRVRYFLRCYLKAEEDENGNLIKKRYLSLVPKENEFGIARGLDESSVPSDIPLEWSDFANAIGYNLEVNTTTNINNKHEQDVKAKVDVDFDKIDEILKVKTETKTTNSEQSSTVNDTEIKSTDKVVETIEKAPAPINETKPLTNEEKLAAIRAKLAAVKAKKGE